MFLKLVFPAMQTISNEDDRH